MRTSTGKPTKYEQKRIDAMLRLGCVCCAQLGLWNTAVDIHHIVEGNRRLGHWYSLPCCPGHHRGVWSAEQIEAIPPDLRTALSDGSKLFAKQYGTERELWMKIQSRLKLPAIWPTSKILPRRHYVASPESTVELVSRPVVVAVPSLPGTTTGDQGSERTR